MQRELSSFPIQPSLMSKLTKAGFTTVEDLTDLKPLQLSQELSISNEEALDLLNLVRGEHPSKLKLKQTTSFTAFDMLQNEESQQCIVTFSEQLDNMLGGGLPVCKITEFCGAPGAGKTQISIQLSVDVQIPTCFGGLQGEAVYIDTEGSFVAARAADIAKATVEHCSNIAQAENNEEQLKSMEAFTWESVLAGIHYYRCNDYLQLLATVHLLPEFLTQHPKVKLIVVDSIAFHFRHDFDDFSLRTRILNGMAQSFIKLATQLNLAVMLTNQMTTRVNADGGSHLTPALGESWGHASTIRVILYWRDRQRYARLYKSPSKQDMTVPFQVTLGGIRDVKTSEDQSHNMQGASTSQHKPQSNYEQNTNEHNTKNAQYQTASSSEPYHTGGTERAYGSGQDRKRSRIDS
ncbi:unnamed protein product [Owenia fusiformis]|uniref:DNA repair protein RAD51 homolog 3 n=1 Tax=Owenia fusiformis TaxID=6347 RepID=A0A8J1TN52_OWEFU|nr:unnamed protein product [Owenia fusiformis]